ncbi:MAG: hypothetical protein JWP13_475 [Candidatus Saccharibacteria bacterium]|nr:hypothetical protein [Candidatus Saccharibacteria bacterium]
MQLIADMDPYFPEEDAFEVLVGAVSAWGVLETKVLFPALEANLEGSETVTAPARERLNTLYSLESTIHDGEGAEGPFNELAPKYIDAVKYHLVVDVKELVPLASQLTEAQSVQLARSMTAMKLEME